MARFGQTVVLEPVPRAWFDRAVGLCFDTAVEYFADAGEPPAAKAQYGLPDKVTTVFLESWQRDGETAGRSYAMDDGMVSIFTARLDSPGNPRAADVSGDLRSTYRGPMGWMSAVSATAHLDLPTWWDGTARQGVGPAITGQGQATGLRGSVTVVVAPARGGRWQVTARVTLRGRGLLRPVTSVALLFFRSQVKRRFTKRAVEFARRWNEEVPPLLTKHQDELRELITEKLTGTIGS